MFYLMLLFPYLFFCNYFSPYPMNKFLEVLYYFSTLLCFFHPDICTEDLVNVFE